MCIPVASRFSVYLLKKHAYLRKLDIKDLNDKKKSLEKKIILFGLRLKN